MKEKKKIDLTGLVGEPAKVSNVVTQPDEKPQAKSPKPEIPVKKMAPANDRRRRTVHFDAEAESNLMRLSGYLMSQGFKPLSEQRMLELALEAAFSEEFDLVSTYEKLKKKERGLSLRSNF